MTSKALILDLDNTIYPVHSIAGELFASLFRLLEESGEAKEAMVKLKEDVQRKPFQWVAAHYGLSETLTQKGIQLLKNLTIPEHIKPFADYAVVQNLTLPKFLVTTGFLKLQLSKITKMGLDHDFQEIHVIDPETTVKTKKDLFAEILERNGLQPSDVVVIGDDPESEIKAAQELGIKAVLYDKLNRYDNNGHKHRITDFSSLHTLL